MNNTLEFLVEYGWVLILLMLLVTSLAGWNAFYDVEEREKNDTTFHQYVASETDAMCVLRLAQDERISVSDYRRVSEVIIVKIDGEMNDEMMRKLESCTQ